MKKVLSLVLVIAMVLSSMSFAFASTFEDVADSDYEVAIETMKALGVIDGFPDGTFRPEGALTRAQLAKLLVEALGFGGLTGGASNFSDTNGHWADSYIAIASGMGLVNGYPDGTFKPEGPVKYEEAYAMVIRALGYTDASLRGVWPTNYMVKALDLGLTKNLALTTGPADRGGVAQVLYNALDAKFVQVDADNKVTAVEEGAKTLIDRLGTEKPLEVSLDNLDPEDKAYKGNVVDLAPYMYQKLTVYENKDGDVVYVKSVDSLVLEGTVDEYTLVKDKDDKVTGVKLEVEDAKEKDYVFNVAAKTSVLLNGDEVNVEGMDITDAKVTIVLDGEDGDKVSDQKVLGVVAKLATITVQAEEDFDKDEVEIIAHSENVLLPVDSKKIDYDRVVVKGDADSLEDIEKYDVLTLFYGKGKINDDVKLEIVVSKDTVEGKLTRISGTNYYIDGKSYKLNDDADELVTKDIGDGGIFYLDYEGKIFALDKDSSKAAGNYALVLNKTDGYQTKAKEGVVLADPKVKLLTASGEEITYVLDLDLDAVVVVKENGTDLEVKLDIGALVEYELDKDKVIDKLTVIEKDKYPHYAKLKTDVNSFNLASNAVIFNVPTADGGKAEENDYAEASVIKADDLDTEINAYRYRVDSEIVVLIVTKGGVAEEDGIFALITNNGGKAYDADEEKTVTLYTTYVDGEKVEYLGLDQDKLPLSVDVVTGTAVEIYELKLSGGKLKGVDSFKNKEGKDLIVSGKANNDRVSNLITTADKDAKDYYLADDVAIYVLKWNLDKTKLVFDKVGAKSDIRGKEFKLFDTVDGDGDYDIVVVWPGK